MYMQLNDFSKLVNRHHTTINNWFNELEKRRIHYVNRTHGNRKERVFDDMDVKLANYIVELKEKKWMMEAIFHHLLEQTIIELRPFPEDYEMNDNQQLISIEGIKQELLTAIEDKFVNMQRKTSEDILLQLKTNERKSNIERLLLEREISRTLHTEALKEWNKPENYKTKWTLKGKVEDSHAKDIFIDNYINENYDRVALKLLES